MKRILAWLRMERTEPIKLAKPLEPRRVALRPHQPSIPLDLDHGWGRCVPARMRTDMRERGWR